MAEIVLDGPCAGSYEWTGERFPLHVVAAIGADGTAAIFDRSDDQLEIGEQPHEYRRSQTLGPGFICYRGRDRHLSGRWLYYEHVGPIGPERVAEILRHYSKLCRLPAAQA
jgi:hypothetical protein